MLESVQLQTYSNWELCIADGSESNTVENIVRRYAVKDLRIKYRHLEKNLGIADNTNAALEMTKGEFIGFLDHDDVLDAGALFEVMKVIEKDSRTDMIYTDEDKVSTDLSEYFDPHFKPDYNKELLHWNNYICHFLVVKRSVIDRVGNISVKHEGAQDYDFILRCSETAENIVHIPRVLYHWRTHQASTAVNPQSKLFAYESGKRAIQEHLSRTNENAFVEHGVGYGFYNVSYQVQNQEMVDIFVLDNHKVSNPSRVKKCVKSIRKTNNYSNYNVHVVGDFNKICWDTVTSSYVVFIDSSLTSISEEWIESLLGCCQRNYVGAVGGKIYSANDTIYHAGIILGMNGYAFEGFPREKSGYFHRESLGQNLSAVTWQFMMAEKDVIGDIVQKAGGFPDDEVDLCREIAARGRAVIYNPNVEAKQIFRKRILKKDEIQNEKAVGVKKVEDPCYNQNLSLRSPGYYLQK
jgi:glycosyltransferase involved in cell wall biosynthesis